MTITSSRHLYSFARAVRYHYENNPIGWQVVKVGAGAWRVVNAAGDAVTGNQTSKAKAEQDLLPTGMYYRRWLETDLWYRGLSTDHRLRELTSDERSLVDSIISEHFADAGAGDCPLCFSHDDDLSYRGGICETCHIEHSGGSN